MGKRLTTTGNFSHTNLGRNWHARKGWRRFFFSDSRCRLQNDQGVTVSGNPAAPCSVDESSGNTVFTFLSGHSGAIAGGFSLDGLVAGMPLLTDEGSVLTFDKPFVLKTMIELISISGDSSDTDEGSSNPPQFRTHPQVTMGLTEETGVDFANDSARHISSGVRIGARNRQSETVGEDAKYLIETLASGGSGQAATTVSSDNCILYISEFHIGPDMATSTNNTRVFRQCFKASGDNYVIPVAALTDVDTNANQGFDNGNLPVTLYAAVQDIRTDAFSGNTPCVLTCRLWYMVEADYYNGFGGSGSA